MIESHPVEELPSVAVADGLADGGVLLHDAG